MADLSKDGAYDNNFNKTDTVQSDTKTQIIQLFRQIKKALYSKQHTENISVWVIKRGVVEKRTKIEQKMTIVRNLTIFTFLRFIKIQYVLD